MPEYWSCNHENEKEGKYFISPSCSLKIFVHPCYLYIETLLELAKVPRNKACLETLNLSSKMRFYDLFKRDYEIDVYEMVNEIKENKNISKALKFAITNDAFNDNDDRNYDESSHYLSELIKTEEEWKNELYTFRQKMIEKSNIMNNTF